MRAMSRFRLGFAGVVAVVVAGCGPSYGGQDAKTPDQIVEEQEKLGDEQVKKEKEHEYSGPVGETDLEKKKKWDKKQADMEIKRATRSAQTCPGSVTEQAPKGVGKVSLTFGNDGHVKTSKIEAPYEGTAVGACVLRALGAVIVPAYEGSEESVDVDVDLTAEVAKTEEKPKTGTTTKKK
jgi:hypothetical protein